MLTLCEYSLEFILPKIGLDKPPIRLCGFNVRANSNRLELFRKSVECVTCKKSGNTFFLQQHRGGIPKFKLNCLIDNCHFCMFKPQAEINSQVPHLNMFHRTEGGKLILMTKDYIIPKSRGGKDSMDNLQTMCCECNCLKGDKIL